MNKLIMILTIFYLSLTVCEAQTFGKGGFKIPSISGGGSGSKSGLGRGKNNRFPLPYAEGDHSVSNSRGSTTYRVNKQNPTGFDEVKKVDTKGKPHKNVPVPHTILNKNNKDPKPSTPDEIPKADLSKP